MRQLKSMIGQIVIARIPKLDAEEMVMVRLHKVETTGIWVEHQNFTDRMMLRCEIAASKTTPILFIPFCGVDFIVSSLDSFSLSESAFGVGEDG